MHWTERIENIVCMDPLTAEMRGRRHHPNIYSQLVEIYHTNLPYSSSVQEGLFLIKVIS